MSPKCTCHKISRLLTTAHLHIRQQSEHFQRYVYTFHTKVEYNVFITFSLVLKYSDAQVLDEKS